MEAKDRLCICEADCWLRARMRNKCRMTAPPTRLPGSHVCTACTVCPVQSIYFVLCNFGTQGSRSASLHGTLRARGDAAPSVTPRLFDRTTAPTTITQKCIPNHRSCYRTNATASRSQHVLLDPCCSEVPWGG